MDRLEQALAIYVDWLADDGRVEPSELLSRHGDLSDLLEAMFADRDGLTEGVARAQDEGRVLGDFRIVEEIGRGGMGVVYRARQISLDREVALKVLPAHVTRDPSAIARFRREAMTAAKLEHPRVVRVFGVGSEGDLHWFAMELVDGQPLSRRDPRTGAVRTVRACVELCAAVADALEYVHGRGVVHRDVKPSNILVRADDQPVLTDLGLARDLEQPGLTQTGAFAGTPYYVSPEQASGRGVVDGRADVFSLAATLYELLTGTRPFDGETVQAVLAQIARAEPDDPVRIVPDLSPDLAAVVLKGLEKEPARRYASAAAFAADLRAFLDYRPVSARRASGVTRLRRWARREPLRAAIAAVLAVCVPAISASVGYLVANRNAIEIGTGQIRELRRQELLAGITIDYEAGDFGPALAAADAAVASDPDDVEARALRAIVQLATGSAEAALTEIGTEHGRDPDLEDRARVYVLTVLGRVADAQAIERRLGPPTRPEELYLAGCVAAYRARRDGGDRAAWERVRDVFAHAMRVSPAPRLHYYVRWMEAVQVCADSVAIADAEATLRELWPDSPAALLYVAFALKESDPARAVDDYRRVLAAGHDHPRIHSTIADCLDRLGDREAASAARRRSVASFVKREAAGIASPDECVNVAIVLHDSGDVPGAVEAARRATQRHPSMSRAWLVLGWLLGESGDQRGCADAYREATVLRPNDPEALRRLGVALSNCGDPSGAADVFRRLTDVRPNDAIAHHQLGNALLASGDTAGAIATNRIAVELEPSRPELRFNLAYALNAAREWEEAERVCADAIALRETYTRAHALLGDIRAARGDSAAAAASYRTALEQNPSVPATWRSLGEALLRIDDREGARGALREAVDRAAEDPASVPMLRAVATALVTAGDVDGARAALTRALACGPGDQERQQVERELGGLPAAGRR